MWHSISRPQKRAEKVPGVQEARDSAKWGAAWMSLDPVRWQGSHGPAPKAGKGEAGSVRGGDREMTGPGQRRAPRRPGSAGAFAHRSIVGDSRTAGQWAVTPREQRSLIRTLSCPTRRPCSSSVSCPRFQLDAQERRRQLWEQCVSD